MAIRDLLLTNNDPEQAMQELKLQWNEMAGDVNNVTRMFRQNGSGVVDGMILVDTAGHYWKITVSTTGVLTTADLGTFIP